MDKHRHGLGNCGECYMREDLCNTLCPEAEAYVDQDCVSQKEFTIGLPKYNSVFLSTKTNEEIIIYEYFIMRMKQSEIAELLNISRQYVSRIVMRYKEILRKNLQK